MGAARYVGRVGGLAVALGAGMAIFIAPAVASAETNDASGTSTSSTSTTSANASAASAEKSPEKGTDDTASTTDEGPDKAKGPDASEDPDEPEDATVLLDDKASTHRRAHGNSEPDDADAREFAATDLTTAAADEKTDASVQDVPSGMTTVQSTAPAATRVPYAPVIDVVDGVITGDNPASSKPLTYNVIKKPVNHGKVTVDPTTGDFTFLPHSDQLTPDGTDRFKVLAAEKTPLDALLDRNALVKALIQPIIVRLHQVPVLRDLLAPVIGRSQDYWVEVKVADYLGDGPIAFTTTVVSPVGNTPISVNYFPTLHPDANGQAPTILNGPSLATAGYTDPTQQTTVFGLVPGLAVLRQNYNVVTWDPRGEFASGGILHLDSEDYEAQDVSAILDWVARQPGTELGPGPSAGTTDPLIGMVGGSYGGGIQFTSAGIDDRIDAIAPGIAWNQLTTALYPNDAFKTSWASLLLLSLVVSGSRIDPQIYSGIVTGAALGFLTPAQKEFLSANSPATVIGNIKVPTLFLQGTVDGLFTLQQALDNAAVIDANAPVKMIWYCGGHGACLDLDALETAAQTQYLVNQTMQWMDTYVMNKATAPADIPGAKFTWIDQKGDWYTSDTLPPDVDTSSFAVSRDRDGYLPIVPGLGGSGPQSQATFPVSLTLAAKSDHALDVAVRNQGGTTYIVGAPTVTLKYSGLGTSRHVFAQLVDNTTGRVVGNLVTPIPVTLDGRTHEITVDMENIAYTMGAGDSLTLQIVDSASAYENFTAFGVIHVDRVDLRLPVATDVDELIMDDGDAVLATRSLDDDHAPPRPS